MMVLISNIIYELLTNKNSGWIIESDLDEHELNTKETISQIQLWLVENKQTRTYARFLEKYCRRDNITLKEYLALAWSVLWFDGYKLKPNIEIKCLENKDKPKKKKSRFRITLERIKLKHKYDSVQLYELDYLLNHFITKDVFNCLCYYGVTSVDWITNRLNHKDIIKYNMQE